MKRLLLASSIVLCGLRADALASLRRVRIDKSTQATAPIKFTLTPTTADGMVMIHFVLPANQRELADLWRVDFAVRKGKGTLLDVPLAMTVTSGERSVDFIVDPAAMTDVELWIRTGPYAPLAETIYAIDVGSFK